MMGVWGPVALAGPHANNLHLDNHTNTLSLNFYRPNALHDTQPTQEVAAVLRVKRQITAATCRIALRFA